LRDDEDRGLGGCVKDVAAKEEMETIIVREEELELVSIEEIQDAGETICGSCGGILDGWFQLHECGKEVNCFTIEITQGAFRIRRPVKRRRGKSKSMKGKINGKRRF
jgi:hypothetical protein